MEPIRTVLTRDTNASVLTTEAQQVENKHDRLWADLQALDHDQERSQYVQERKGFLGPAHAQKLSELRRIQKELSEEMEREEEDLGVERYQELWNITDPDELYQRLYDDRYFELLNDHVEKSAAKIDEIAAVIDANEINNENQRNEAE